MWFEAELKLKENTPTLHTDRLILRKFTPDDADALLAVLSDREVNTFLPWFPLDTLEQAADWIQSRYLDRCSAPWGYQYAICRKEDNLPIGYIGLSPEESLDFGYGLRRDCWGKGYASEAGAAVLSRLREAGFPYVTATHDRNNPASGGVMKKLGMTYRYSYHEQWQPKDIPVVFRLYQLDFRQPPCPTFGLYREKYPSFVEELGGEGR